MNFRRLQYFVKIVDVGSLTQAADILHVAQPALSQQLATLEAEARQQLLVRTKRGVTPTAAGTVLYRHAQLILRQCDQARADMKSAGQGLSGAVSVGLAPGTAAAGLAVPLLRTVRERHPGVVLYLNETYGTTLSELIMTGRMDLAVLYGGTTAVHGLSFQLLLLEPLFLVGPAGVVEPAETVPLRDIMEMELFLPRPYNIVRKMVDDACAGPGLVPHVVAEIESDSTITAVIDEGLGATILPESMARRVVWRPRPGGRGLSRRRSRRRSRSASPTTCRCRSRRRRSRTCWVDLAAGLPGATLKMTGRKPVRRT